MIKIMVLMASIVLGVAGCAAEDGSSTDDNPQTSEATSASTICWSAAGIYDTACNGLITTVHSGNDITVTGTPFLSSCDGNYWVQVDWFGRRADMRWDAFCH
jgi:hypothetical protein